ncbi:MAG: phosphotransferase [Ectobacillus sp.]
MKTNKKHEKGDAYGDRLFSFLHAHRIPAQKIIQLKPSVFFVQTDLYMYILKGYNTYGKMLQQLYILKSLQHIAFPYTSYIRAFPEGRLYIKFDGKFWLFTDYIEHTAPFSFVSAKNRGDALTLLNTYHQYARRLPYQLLLHVPFQRWLSKWNNRTWKFYHHLRKILFYVDKEVANQCLRWAFFALSELSHISMCCLPHTILHGDIVEHNFVRGETLYLIDFDCVSFGPVMYDYLSYCYSVLPCINWSFEALYQYKELHPFLNQKPFLLSLIFPGDILREWSHFLSLPLAEQLRFQKKIVAFTEKQYEYRLAFVRKLYNMVT